MAIRRSRGVRSLTTLPPIRISPAVGVSRPAIMRRRVVFPEPDGPRKTRNSPSRVSRLTLLTAPSSPSLNTLVRSLVSTTAIHPPFAAVALLESLEDAFVLLLCCGSCILSRLLSLGNFREHRGNYPGIECLVD